MERRDRVSADRVGNTFVGTYQAPDQRIAVVTEHATSREAALEAAERWVAAEDSGQPHKWLESTRYPGRYEVFVNGRLGLHAVLRAHP